VGLASESQAERGGAPSAESYGGEMPEPPLNRSPNERESPRKVRRPSPTPEPTSTKGGPD
jgi:hypothetical protein